MTSSHSHGSPGPTAHAPTPQHTSPSWSGMPRTTTTRCRSCSATARAPGSRMWTAGATSTASPGYSALNFGHGHPRLLARAHEQLARLTLTSRAFHNDQLGPFAEALAAADRQGHGPADEHRRRGRRDRAQGGPQVGLPRQGRARERGEHHRHGGQLPRPHDDHRQLLRRQGGARRVRPLHAGVPHRHLRGRRRAAPRGRRHHGRRAPRAGAGGGRCRRPARGLPARRARHLRRGRRPHGGRRDPERAGPDGSHLRLRPRGRRARHLRARQGPRRRALPRLGGRRRPRGARGHHPRVARLDLRGQPPGRGDRSRGRHHARRGSVPGAGRPPRPVLEERLAPLVGRGAGLRAVRVRGLWAGLDIEPGGPSGRELCERLLARGILVKDTHGSTIRLAPPLVVTEDEIGLLVDAIAASLAALWPGAGRSTSGSRRASGPREACEPHPCGVARDLVDDLGAARPRQVVRHVGEHDELRPGHRAGRGDPAARHDEPVARPWTTSVGTRTSRSPPCGRGWPGWRAAAGSCRAG